MEWKEFDDKSKVCFIIANVLGWPCFESWEDMSNVHPRQRSYPLAFWDSAEDEWRVFHQAKEDAETFDPLRSMTDAWKIIEWTENQSGGVRYQFDYILECFLREAYAKRIPGGKPRLRLDYIMLLTPELICRAAWQLIHNNEGGNP